MRSMSKIKIPILLLLLAVIPASANAYTAKTSHKSIQAEYASTLDDIERVSTWTVFKELSSVKIEYKFQECNSTVQGGFKNLNVVFFKFTNLTSNSITVSYVKELYFDGECVNCHKLEKADYKHTIELGPNEVKEGNCDSRESGLYISANFINLVPGMSGTQLTDFKFVNLETKVIK